MKEEPNDELFVVKKNPELIPIEIIQAIKEDIEQCGKDVTQFINAENMMSVSWFKKGLQEAINIIENNIKEYQNE